MTHKLFCTLSTILFGVAAWIAPLNGHAQQASVNIIGGEFAPRYAGQDVTFIETDEYGCSGTLIGSREVLTAAHCIANGPGPSGYRVYVGRQWMSVQSAWYHARYDDSQPAYRMGKYDLGMLILSQPVTTVPPIPVLRGSRIARGTKVAIAVYGTNERSGSPGRSFLDDFKIGLSRVTEANGHTLNCFHRAFNASTCSGDSGGPVMVAYSKKGLAVVGVISSGTNRLRNDTCYLYGGGFFSTTDLQSPASRSFLSNFKGVRYARMQLRRKR